MISPYNLIITATTLGAVFWLLKYWSKGSRSQTWRRKAALLGFSYSESEVSVLQQFSNLDTFSRGTQGARNLLQSDSDGCWRCIFDYADIAGDNRTDQTICLVQSDLLALPHFNIQPATWLSRQALKLAGQTAALPFIEHPDDPEFNSAYHLQGADAAAVHAVLTPEVRTFFKSQRAREFCFEAEGPTFLFHTRTLIPPDHASDKLRESLEILRVFARNR